MSQEFYINLISMMTLFFINYLKYRSDIRITERKQDNSHEFLKEKINSLELIIKEDVLRRDFRTKLETEISHVAFSIIQANTDLTPEIINILNQFQLKISNFAIKYIDSPYRNNKTIVDNYINIELETIINDIRHLSNDTFKNKKNDLIFYNYVVKYSNLNTHINVLIQRLKENGLTKDEYINLFKRFTKNAMLEIIKGYRKWVLS